jgi:hypothetical protein
MRNSACHIVCGRIIHKHVSVQTVRDDLETLVMDSDVLDDLLAGPDAPTPKEVEIRIATWLRQHLNDPRFPHPAPNTQDSWQVELGGPRLGDTLGAKTLEHFRPLGSDPQPTRRGHPKTPPHLTAPSSGQPATA